MMTNFGRGHIELSNSPSTTFLNKIKVEIKGFETFTLKNTKNSAMATALCFPSNHDVELWKSSHGAFQWSKYHFSKLTRSGDKVI